MTALCRDADVPSPGCQRWLSRAAGGRHTCADYAQRHQSDGGGLLRRLDQNLIARCKGVHEPQEEVAFAEVIRHLADDANDDRSWGYWSCYSIWFLTQGGSSRHRSSSPIRRTSEVGRTNARLNAVRNRSLSKHSLAVAAAPPSKLRPGVGHRRNCRHFRLPDLLESHAIEMLTCCIATHRAQK